MGFLAPWFLAGLAALGIPLYLHLLRQHQRTPKPFPSLMFFERRPQSAERHRRLRYLTLLALRLLLLFLLALAFANPFINRPAASATQRKLTVIAIDRSFSMRYGNRMNAAKETARRVLAGVQGRGMTQVVAVDSHVEALTQPERDKTLLSGAIESVEPNDKASSFGEFVRALRVMDQTTGMHLDVHFISDMQETSMPADFRDLQVGPHTSLILHKTEEANSGNWAVASVVAPARANGKESNRVTASIAGWGTEAAAKQVSLALDGKVISTKPVEVGKDGHAQVEFASFEVPYGAHRGEVRLEPHDSLPEDDSFPFAIERTDPQKVLFLYAGSRARQDFFYKAAIEAGTSAELSVQSGPVEDATGRDFSPFAFVVLSDVGELDQKLSDQLCAYVQKGGAVLIALGPKTARGGRIPLSKDSLNEQRQTQGAGYVDTGDAAMASGGRFENVQFLETAWVTPKPAERVIAKFADGTPLLVEQRSGEGRKLIFASTLDDATNDFAQHASYLPFVVQTGHYLAGGDETQPNVVSGTAVSLRHTADQSTAADVIGPDGKHELSLSDATKALSFEPVRSGFYEVTRAGGQRLLLAVHADRRESDLKAVPDETLNLWRNTGSTAAPAEGAGSEQQNRPWSLWRYMIGAVLAAALVEWLFGSRYLREEGRQAV